MIKRFLHRKAILDALDFMKVVAIIGPRQVGKTTLAREIIADHDSPVSFFDLESPSDLARLSDPQSALERLKGLVVLDEIHRLPEIFPVLRVLADRVPLLARFMVLGSASGDLMKQTSESLAGRIAYHELRGFSLKETGFECHESRWLRGGFPDSFLARDDANSIKWRNWFIQTFLERDIPQFGIRVPSSILRRFWTMLAHWHGQVWNAAQFARSFDMSVTAVNHYLDILCSTYMVRKLQPWHANIRKRQVKSPRIFIRDTGILHALLGLATYENLESHPVFGFSWEGFIMEQLIEHLDAKPDECYFWSTYQGSELDLVIMKGSQLLGFEIKRTGSPVMTASMHHACRALKLKELVVIHGGKHTFSMKNNVRAVSFMDIYREI